VRRSNNVCGARVVPQLIAGISAFRSNSPEILTKPHAVPHALLKACCIVGKIYHIYISGQGNGERTSPALPDIFSNRLGRLSSCASGVVVQKGNAVKFRSGLRCTRSALKNMASMGSDGELRSRPARCSSPFFFEPSPFTGIVVIRFEKNPDDHDPGEWRLGWTGSRVTSYCVRFNHAGTFGPIANLLLLPLLQARTFETQFHKFQGH